MTSQVYLQPVACFTLSFVPPHGALALRQPHTTIAARDVNRDAGPDQWHVTLHNPTDHAALMLWLEDASSRGTIGWPYVNDNYFCLLPDETRRIVVTWHRIPPEERELTLSGWNIAPMRI